jgi:hypothetical protein
MKDSELFILNNVKSTTNSYFIKVSLRKIFLWFNIFHDNIKDRIIVSIINVGRIKRVSEMFLLIKILKYNLNLIHL